MRGAGFALLILLCAGGGLVQADEAPPAPTIAELEAAWRAAPQDVAAGLALQDAMQAAGLRTSAQRLFRRAAESARDDAVAQFLYGRVQGDARGLEAMRAALATELGGRDVADRGLLAAAIALAVAEVLAGEARPAAQAAERVTSLRGLAADWTYLGWIRQYLLGEGDAALEAYAQALRKDERSLRARREAIGLMLDRKRIEDAFAYARKGVELHPEDSSAQRVLGLVHAAAGRTQEALVAFDAAHAHAGEDPSALAAVASAYAAHGRPEQARAAYDAALEADPKHGVALGAAGLLALDEGRLDDARTLLERAGRVRPKDARIAFLQGTCAQRMGLQTSAATSFRRAYDLEPDRPEYLEALALAYVAQGSIAPGVRLLQRAIADRPGDAELRFQLGLAWMKKRSYREARTAFLDAAERAPSDLRPHFYLALILGDKLGKAKEALAELDRYVELGGKEPQMLAWRASLAAERGRK